MRHLIASAQRAIAVASAMPLANALAKGTGIAASVIIATRNKASYLDLTLASLERQLFPAEMWEVVVADDASQDDTTTILGKYVERGRLRLASQRLLSSHGVAQSRRQAVEAAKGNILIFLGEDCLTTPDFLLHHLRHHLDSNNVVLGDCSRLVHTHLFAPAEVLLNGVSARQVFEANDLNDLQALRPFIFHSGYDSRQDVLRPLAWVCSDAANASVKRETALSDKAQTEQTVCFEPRAYTIRQLRPRTPAPLL